MSAASARCALRSALGNSATRLLGTRRISRAAMLLAALALPSRNLAAQEGREIRALSGEDAERFVALLRAQVEAARALARRAPDPLTHARRQSRYVAGPPGAAYDAECSLYSGRPIFTLGLDFTPDEYRALRITAQSAKADSVVANGPAGRAIDAAVRWYVARGFGDQPRIREFQLKRSDADSAVVSVFYQYGIFSSMHAHCAHLPMGPTLEIDVPRPAPLIFFTMSDETQMSEPERQFQEALTQANVYLEDFDEILRAVKIARRYARSSVAVEILARGVLNQGTALEDREIALARENVAWYRRHAATLDPLLDALHAAYEGKP